MEQQTWHRSKFQIAEAIGRPHTSKPELENEMELEKLESKSLQPSPSDMCWDELWPNPQRMEIAMEAGK